jgi:hypothetical protein
MKTGEIGEERGNKFGKKGEGGVGLDGVARRGRVKDNGGDDGQENGQ